MDCHVPFPFSRASQVAWQTKVTLQETGSAMGVMEQVQL